MSSEREPSPSIRLQPSPGRLQPMSRLTRNIGANFIANGWSAIVTLGTVPLYIRFLGVEQYGLVGFFAAFQGILLLLDAASALP